MLSFSYIKRKFRSYLVLSVWKTFYSRNYRPSQEMPVVTTLHPVATKHAAVWTTRHGSLPSQDTALSFQTVKHYFFFHHCWLYFTIQVQQIYNRLIRILPTCCYKNNSMSCRHKTTTVVAFTGLHSLKGILLLCILLPLSQRRLHNLRCFSHSLVANPGKSCSSKQPQPC